MKYPNGKPLSLSVARTALRSLYHPDVRVTLTETSPPRVCSLFLNNDPTATIFLSSWELVIAEAVKQLHITKD